MINQIYKIKINWVKNFKIWKKWLNHIYCKIINFRKKWKLLKINKLKLCKKIKFQTILRLYSKK